MTESDWVAALSAWSTFATAALTLALLLMAVAAWRTGKKALVASREASEAARASAEAALAANEQARLDSIEQTRPYVYCELLPGLSGTAAWDIRITNVGKSAAKRLTLDYDIWPESPDDITKSIQDLFRTSRTLPPSCSIRAIWRVEGNLGGGSSEAGLGRTGAISVSYTSDDPSQPEYEDTFDVMIEKSGFWPVGEEGPTPDGLKGEARKFYVLGQALVRRISELQR